MISFCVTTDGQYPERIEKIWESIEAQNIEDYEMIVVGGDIKDMEYVRHVGRWIPFDETRRPGWITRKKNLAANYAKYDTLVMMHDYVYLGEDWYKNLIPLDGDWDICMNRIENIDGSRFRDWCAWDDPELGFPKKCHEFWCSELLIHPRITRPALVPYDYNRTQYMYISGAYFVVRRHVMDEEPLNERILWGQGEDLEWSLRVRNKYKYVMNQNAVVRLMKQKDRVFPYVEELNFK